MIDFGLTESCTCGVFWSNKCSFRCIYGSHLLPPNVHKPGWQMEHSLKRMTSYRLALHAKIMRTLFSVHKPYQAMKTVGTNFVIVKKSMYTFISPNTINETQKKEAWLTTLFDIAKVFKRFCSTSNGYDEIVVFNYHSATWTFRFFRILRIV